MNLAELDSPLKVSSRDHHSLNLPGAERFHNEQTDLACTDQKDAGFLDGADFFFGHFDCSRPKGDRSLAYSRRLSHV